MKHRRAYKKKKKRVGRGVGSGHGKTCCRGSKGQMSRSGAKRTPGFEGGQMTFIRRIPKRGFNNTAFKKRIETVNVERLNALGEREITSEKLYDLGIIKGRCDGIKVLGKGKLDKPVTVHAHYFSEKAKEKIKSVGGEAVVITP